MRYDAYYFAKDTIVMAYQIKIIEKLQTWILVIKSCNKYSWFTSKILFIMNVALRKNRHLSRRQVIYVALVHSVRIFFYKNTFYQ